MQKIIMAALAFTLVGACSYKQERTVVQQPTPASTVVTPAPGSTVVYTDSTPAPTTTTTTVRVN